MNSEASTVNEYISKAPIERQDSLKKIRELFKTLLPNHKENMAYNMPSYKRKGQVEVAFASQKQDICVYFLIHSVMLENKNLLKGFNHGKGVIRFSKPEKVDFELLSNLAKKTLLKDDSIC